MIAAWLVPDLPTDEAVLHDRQLTPEPEHQHNNLVGCRR